MANNELSGPVYLFFCQIDKLKKEDILIDFFFYLKQSDQLVIFFCEIN